MWIKIKCLFISNIREITTNIINLNSNKEQSINNYTKNNIQIKLINLQRKIIEDFYKKKLHKKI